MSRYNVNDVSDSIFASIVAGLGNFYEDFV